MADAVLETREASVLTLAINRPERRNALNESVAIGLIAGLDRAEADPAIRVVVLTGVGDEAFCAGGDLKPAADGAAFVMEPADPRHHFVALLKRMDACRLPLIARLNGHALAGGLGLVCACDLAIARDNALLGAPEVRVGLFPMMILPYLLRVMTWRTLMELCLTGEPITAAEAARRQIVNAAVPAAELDARVAALTEKIATNSPSGVRLGKQGLAKIREMSTDSALEYAQFMLANMARTEDVREGFAAFNQRRKPEFTGR